MGEFQKRIVRPLSLPILAVLFIGVLVISLSRVLLAVSEANSTIIALLFATWILGAASLLASVRRIKPAQRALLVVMGILLLGSGVASAEIGVRHEELAIGVPVPIAAKGTAFDKKELDFPADTKVSLHFTNDDVGLAHNVAIFQDKTLSTTLFRGTVITGVASIPYAIPPLKPGNYYFHCDIHPEQMNGKVIVGNEPPGQAEPPPTGSNPPPAGSQPPAGEAPTSASVVAKGLAFNVTQITLKADGPVSITLDNQEALTHNLAIYTEENGTLIEKGVDPFSGPAKKTWTFQAPKPGTYFFHCDVHFNMKGQVIFQ
jgi:plastocyanin